MKNTSEMLLYRTEDGRTEIQVTLQDDTVWLSQSQMAELFQKSIPTINEHIKNAYDESELDEKSTIRKFRIVQAEKKRKVTRTIDFYNLDVIISIGYRVKSHRGTQFRIWATQRLKEYIVKGFVMADRRLAGGATNYFDELIERVRRIRTSERNFYEKVRDIFATSIDYDPQTDYARQFYATVQNKFHYAIHGRTAAELIAERVDSNKPFMGMTNWSGKIITRKEVEIAKNYLEELELKRLELLVEQFLSFAELRVVEKKPMYMADWVKKLDEFLILNEKEILQHAGKVSHKEMEARVREELEKYNEQRQRKQIEGPK
jgi:hypothetical protein